MSLLKVVGFDPSLRNWGVAQGEYDTETQAVSISALDVLQPDPPTGKQLRQNSKDLYCSAYLFAGAHAAAMDHHAVFVEMPVGSQSARAMASYAICVGVLGALKTRGEHFYELTPNEVKVNATGKSTASKKEMIDWAVEKHPEAPWPYYKQHGEHCLNAGKAEHMADAIAAIYAGIQSSPFQQALSLMRAF